ncbi:hypothetical protein CBOM_03879 [Ceraceosorus bombacis]|uniref:Uncharacterized protein n=1 Tax=Ceraceosorus bombacis TaxID=401625 RepID=A0A0P1BH69_9BASI|nr:hypothetical protein CBOM_03879 [Ceraceosorus bombacis]
MSPNPASPFEQSILSAPAPRITAMADGTESPRSCPSTPGSSEMLARFRAFELMAGKTYRIAKRSDLFATDDWSCVALRFSKHQYIVYPEYEPQMSAFVEQIGHVNCEAALTMTTEVCRAVTASLPPGTTELALTADDRVQVVESMFSLGTSRKAQGACFIRSEGRLIVWTDRVEDLVEHANDTEGKMVNFVWQKAGANRFGTATPAPGDASPPEIFERVATPASPVPAVQKPNPARPSLLWRGSSSGLGYNPFRSSRSLASVATPAENVEDEKRPSDSTTSLEPVHQQGVMESGRRQVLLGPFYTGCAVAINLLMISIFVRGTLVTCLLDGSWTRMIIVVLVLPVYFLVSMFFCDTVVAIIAHLIMPVSQLHGNGLYFSGERPRRITGNVLPHVTVQMPVYKEGLESVLMPTIESLKKAVATYELQGGTANILVSEDGMQLFDAVEQDIRRDYYDRNNIGWVARPKHNSDGFIRKGRFKKASNLNFTCSLSMRVEQIMNDLRPEAQARKPLHLMWSAEDEKSLYTVALEQAIEEGGNRAWASGDIRIGDYILIIDSDTRVPEDCFLDSVSEMEHSPEVGVLQHCSGVMYVANNYFEALIGHFTKMVNYSISWVVANGSMAPFVGHNAFMRWSAVQEVSFVDDEGDRCIWAWDMVSEDFDMSLRLVVKGYIVRWATWSKDGFLEGVSLTPDDEVNRLQKYGWGCSEIMLNPISQWWRKGPFAKMFLKWLFSSVALSAKFSTLSYMFSYLAIAISLPVTVALFVLQGFFYPEVDHIFLTSFQVWVAVVVVYGVGGTIGLVISRARSKHETIARALYDHLKWMPSLIIFFIGVGYHVLMALIAHPVGYNMSWAATLKDIESSNFWRELPAILKKYWHCLLVNSAIVVGVVLCTTPILPMEWRVDGVYLLFPPLLLAIGHILYPFLLSPYIMSFQF